MGCLRHFVVHHQKDNGKNVLFTPIRYYQNTSQVGQGKGEGKRKWKRGYHLLENRSIKHLVKSGGMEGFSFEGDVCSQVISFNSCDIAKG